MGTGDELTREAERIRESLVLGRSGTLIQLFDFLVAASPAADAPKEIDIATTVFGKTDTTDLSQDATVRVYIHRLRRKLESFYAKDNSTMRLDIPRGSYRLLMVASDGRRSAGVMHRWPNWIWPVVALATVNLMIWLFVWPRSNADDVGIVRQSAPWAAIIADNRPVVVVLGDYYLFGESDPKRGVDRLVREYAINSPTELDAFLMANPDKAGNYRDLDQSYLPTGSSWALHELLPILVRSDAERTKTRIVMASRLNAGMLKNANVIYIGYFSGLGPLLRGPAFAGSRLSVGNNWDELIDTKTGRHFYSQQGGPDQPGNVSRDYGYMSTFTGPVGNHLVVLSGTRDVGLMQVASTVSHSDSLAKQNASARNTPNYEALYQVEGVDRVNMSGKLILSSPLATDHIWGGGGALLFPKG
jgi:hypothetical protein